MTSYVRDDVCVEAKVNVAPDVKIKGIKASIVGEPVVEDPPEEAEKCSYWVSQMLCVKYKIAFSADVQTQADGIICNPHVEPCKEPLPDTIWLEPVPVIKDQPVAAAADEQAEAKETPCPCQQKAEQAKAKAAPPVAPAKLSGPAIATKPCPCGQKKRRNIKMPKKLYQKVFAIQTGHSRKP